MINKQTNKQKKKEGAVRMGAGRRRKSAAINKRNEEKTTEYSARHEQGKKQFDLSIYEGKSITTRRAQER